MSRLALLALAKSAEQDAAEQDHADRCRFRQIVGYAKAREFNVCAGIAEPIPIQVYALDVAQVHIGKFGEFPLRVLNKSADVSAYGIYAGLRVKGQANGAGHAGFVGIKIEQEQSGVDFVAEVEIQIVVVAIRETAKSVGLGGRGVERVADKWEYVHAEGGRS